MFKFLNMRFYKLQSHRVKLSHSISALFAVYFIFLSKRFIFLEGSQSFPFFFYSLALTNIRKTSFSVKNKEEFTLDCSCILSASASLN